MNFLAITLSISLASLDGGVISDAPVVEVQSATKIDGGSLPDGWLVSRPQMTKLGEKLAKCNQCQSGESVGVEGGPSWGFWAGVALGSTATAVAVVAITSLIGR